MSDIHTFFYKKNGLRVKYTTEYKKWEDKPWIDESISDIPSNFMPFPEFEKHSFCQTVRHRIRTGDLFGTKEFRQQQELLNAHRKKRYQAWFQKLEEDKKKQEIEIAEACRPEKLRATGVDKLLQQIQNATDIDIEGVHIDAYDKDTLAPLYHEVEFSRIDDITIDLGTRNVKRDGVVILEIPETQLCPIYAALQNWRLFATEHGQSR